MKFPESQYADNAQYWLGETYYVMRKFLPAIDEYNKLVEHFPRSKKKSHAILKIGYSYYELGMMEESAKALKELIEEFDKHANITPEKTEKEDLCDLTKIPQASTNALPSQSPLQSISGPE